MKQIRKIIAVILMSVLVLTACGGQAQGEQTLYVAIEKTFSTLNPQDSNVLAEKEVMGQYIEGLYGYDQDNNLIPLGAESYEVSEDGLTYTFKMREGVVWANGDANTAKDYEFAWKVLIANNKAAFRTQAYVIENAKEIVAGTMDKETLGVKALDDNTLEVKLIRPYPAFLHMITGSTFYPIHEETFNRTGSEDYGTTPENTIENGPFLFDSYEVGSKIILKKNPKYWDAANVKLDTVDISIVPELTTQSVLFDNGELDIIRVQGELSDMYNDTDNVVQSQENRMLYMYLSTTIPSQNEIFKNKNFRKAISLAIDKSIIADNIMKDGSIEQNSLFPKGFMDVEGQDFREFTGKHNDSIYDVAKAQEYIELAKQELGLEKITFNFAVQDMVTYKKVFENVKSQVETNLPGVTMNIEMMANQIYFPTLLEYNTPAAMVTWSASYIDYQNFTNQFESTSTYDLSKYVNPAFDAKVNAGSIEMDPIKQANLFSEAEDILMEDAVFIPLYQLGASYKLNPKIKNFKVRGTTPSIAYKYIEKE